MSNDTPVTVSYLILCHDSPERISRLVTKILSEDSAGNVVIHFDKRASKRKYEDLQSKLRNISRCYILKNRIKCGWGQWSLVEATLRMSRYAISNNSSTHYYLLSENCYPTQSVMNLKAHLNRFPDANFIECEAESWIKEGIRKDRLVYRHYFNKEKKPKLHRLSYRLQKKIGIKKKLPSDICVRYGSQWWCLTSSAINNILEYNDVYAKYFKYAWIPDEMYFQTVIYNNESMRKTIKSKSLTSYEFDEKGKVKIINNPELHNSEHFFCRKFFDFD